MNASRVPGAVQHLSVMLRRTGTHLHSVDPGSAVHHVARATRCTASGERHED